MVQIGYKLMSEEHAPSELVRNAQRAEEVGFDFAAISDHYSPWLNEQGHSPFAWSVLGAVSAVTQSLRLMTAVTCPTVRYHPAIIAQGAATLALLSDDRFTLGLGSGERLNEHVVGTGWPGLRERQQRLSEALDIISALLTGEAISYQGKYFQVDKARLFDCPATPPDIVSAAGGPVAARLAGSKANGVITTDASNDIIQAFHATGGNGPHYAEVGLCYADSEKAARKTAHHYFRWSLAGWPVMAELPDTNAFTAATAHVSPEDVAKKVSCGPSTERHVQAIQRYIDAGFDHVILVQVGPDQQPFLDFFEQELLPALRRTA